MWGDGKWHLYDIKKDPGETTPLEAEQPERLQKMIAIYDNYAKEKGIVPVADDWSPWSAM
jgi:arylsulfatase